MLSASEASHTINRCCFAACEIPRSAPNELAAVRPVHIHAPAAQSLARLMCSDWLSQWRAKRGYAVIAYDSGLFSLLKTVGLAHICSMSGRGIPNRRASHKMLVRQSSHLWRSDDAYPTYSRHHPHPVLPRRPGARLNKPQSIIRFVVRPPSCNHLTRLSRSVILFTDFAERVSPDIAASQAIISARSSVG